ncbi:MAG TPA: Xaa-Pro peptidase family protein [Phototrophicaceae bacterium]|nr:Xaa-Pro peptidase family protein [Phototrophicaceae bacterium]
MDTAAFDYQARCERVQERLRAANLDYLLVSPSSDLFYLIGLNRPQSERLTLLLIPREGRIRLVLPAFERALAEPLAKFFDLVTWEETESPTELVASVLPNQGSGLKLGTADKMFVHFQYKLQAALPDATFVSGGSVMNPVRMIKEPLELEYLTRAGAAADQTFLEFLKSPIIGISEIEAKARLYDLMVKCGHDAGGGGIIGVGENGASPHHHVSARKIAPGEGVVADFGGTVHGYWSDITRTFFVGQPPDEFRKVYDIVNQANQAAFEAVKPGVTAESIDQVARGLISKAGYGDAFLHRTGHGLGFDIHETPYIVGGDKTVLEAGMVFSIEPGIYLRGKFGVRIEDIVTVTANGARRFNQSTHELQIVTA